MNLTVDDDGLLVLCKTEETMLTEEVSKWTQPKARRRKGQRVAQRVAQQVSEDDGTVRLVVEPQEQAASDADGAVRRSRRKRTVLVYNT